MDERDDSYYYAQREREERLIAQRARDPAIAAIHRDMADRHAALADGRPLERAARRLLRIVT